MTFVVASLNPGKLRELSEILGGYGLQLVPLDRFGAPAPDETGATLIENARIKARAAAERTGLPAIADDTGLEVDALGGAPGVRSARFAGPGATDADNLRRLLEELREVPDPRRTARFRTVCLACFPGGREAIGEGTLEGRITKESRGSGGFGYDPVFEVLGLGRTLAELTADEKHAISHRARAIQALARRLDLARAGPPARGEGP